MAPRVKFQKEDIVRAALNVARRDGIEAVTAREVAAELQVSPRPIFTWYESMDALRSDVYALAKELYEGYIRRGLEAAVPFRGIWEQYLSFAREEPELYRLLFLTPPGKVSGGASAALRFSQELARDSLMRMYRLNAREADCYFRDIWLLAFSYATLIVTEDCPYTMEQMLDVGTELSLSILKAYKEIPGFPDGNYDKHALFRELMQL